MKLIYSELVPWDLVMEFREPQALARWLVGYPNTRRAQSLGLEFQEHVGMPQPDSDQCLFRIWLIGPERAQTIWLIGRTEQDNQKT